MRKGDEHTKQILLFVPYNFRERPTKEKDYSMGNQIAVLPVALDLVNEFKNGVKIISKDLRPTRESFMCMGMYYYVKLGFKYFPPTVPLGVVMEFAEKTSILATNVRGPPVAYHIGGKESIKVTTFMPNLGDIAGGFAVVSH